MAGAAPGDWDAAAYASFRGQRLRPALDLLAQVPDAGPGAVIDLGCGDGAAGPALRRRFPDRRLLGLDSSPAMLDRARQGGAYDRLVEADAGRWRPSAPPGVIFSNAVLQWLPDHPRLLPWLAHQLAPGGVLAVQMPANFAAPSHRLLREAASVLFPDRFQPGDHVGPVAAAADYLAWLAPLGALEVWETTYHMLLAPAADGAHPVRAFTRSTAMRPFLERLSPAEGARLHASYDAALALAYPLARDGSVRLAFTRLFLVLERG